jgi:hypothetical protein
MPNLSVKLAAFLIADGILFILLGASRFIWPETVGMITSPPFPPNSGPLMVAAGVRAMYNYYSYGGIFIAVGVALLLVRYVRNRPLKGTLVLENSID